MQWPRHSLLGPGTRAGRTAAATSSERSQSFSAVLRCKRLHVVLDPGILHAGRKRRSVPAAPRRRLAADGRSGLAARADVVRHCKRSAPCPHLKKPSTRALFMWPAGTRNEQSFKQGIWTSQSCALQSPLSPSPAGRYGCCKVSTAAGWRVQSSSWDYVDP